MKFNAVLRRYHSLIREADPVEYHEDPYRLAVEARYTNEEFSPDPDDVLASFAIYIKSTINMDIDPHPGSCVGYGIGDGYQGGCHWLTYLTWNVERHMIAVSDETMGRARIADDWTILSVSLLDRFGPWSAYIQIPETSCRIGTIFGAFVGISCDQFGRNLFVALDRGLDRYDTRSLTMFFYSMEEAETFGDIVSNICLHVNHEKFEDCTLDLFYEMRHRRQKEPGGVVYDSAEDFLKAKEEIARILLPLIARAVEPCVKRRLYALPDYASTEDDLGENTVDNEAREQMTEDEAASQFTPLRGDLLPVHRPIVCLDDAVPVSPQVLFI